MRILRIYKTGGESWVSSRALLGAMKADEKVKIVRHHPNVDVGDAIAPAVLGLKIDLYNTTIQAIVTMLWSWIIALFILWSPIFHAMLPEVRGAIWIGAGICVLIAVISLVRAEMDKMVIETYLEMPVVWQVEEGPTMLPPVVAWRKGE